MIQIITKLTITAILGAMYFSMLYFIWTREIDLYRTLIKPIAGLLQTNDHGTIQIDDRNVMVVRFLLGNKLNGNLGLIFYDSIRFVNSTDKNITVKSVHLRYEINGNTQEDDSFYLNTSQISTPQGTVDCVSIRKQGDAIGGSVANLVLMRWKNLRTEISEEKSLIPGAVWGGSAAFILNVKEVKDFEKIRHFDLVVVDYSGNESIQKITVQPRWIEEARSLFVENRSFTIDSAGKVTYSK